MSNIDTNSRRSNCVRRLFARLSCLTCKRSNRKKSTVEASTSANISVLQVEIQDTSVKRHENQSIEDQISKIAEILGKKVYESELKIIEKIDKINDITAYNLDIAILEFEHRITERVNRIKEAVAHLITALEDLSRTFYSIGQRLAARD